MPVSKHATKTKRGKQVTYNDGDLDIIKAELAKGLTPGKIVEVHKVRGWTLRTAQRWVQKIKKGEDVATKRKTGGGRKLLEPDLAHRIPTTRGNTDGTVAGNLKKIARSVNTSYHRARYAATKKLHLKNVCKVKGSRITAKQEADRVERCKETQRLFFRKKNPILLEDVWFSDEKIFTSTPKSQSARNDRVQIPNNMRKADLRADAIARGVAPHSLSLMVAWSASIQGKVAPNFAPKGPYIDQVYYKNRILAERFLPQITLVAGQRPFHFRQDKAKPHYAEQTAKWLDQHMKGWIKPWMSKGGT